jgi:hypothetical protein
MNCQAVGDKLMELAYDELPDAERREVEAHLAGCAACRAEWQKLRFARSAVAESLADEPPAAAPEVLAEKPLAKQAGRVLLRRARWLQAAAALAAAAMVLLGVFMLHDGGEPIVAAQPGPPEILRLGVSLTILSQPEGWRASPMGQAPPMQQAEVQTQEPMQVTAQPAQVQWRGGQPLWQGMALVRDQRIVRNLRRGRSQVRFADVPSGILPDTVRLRSLLRPDALTVLEQNYQYDLASAAAVLRKHIDKPLTAVFQDGQTVAGTLLSFDDATLVIQPAGEGPRNVSRENLRGIVFAELPQGLLTRPTLVWDLSNRADARQQFEVAYLTHGLTWRADYVLKLHPAKAPAKPQAKRAGDGRESAIRNPQSAIVDTADLIGYATVNNFSGVTYRDAQLKLMAGDVNLIRPPQLSTPLALWYANFADLDGARVVMTEKSFFEYHLYTVTRPTTLRNAETKQLEMVSGTGLKLRRGYVYDPRADRTVARVVSEMENSEANGLGKPLPKGVVRLYAPDPEGQQAYIAQTAIDHTPKDEKLRLPWGYAFDIACSARQEDYRRRGDDHYARWAAELRNHKPHGVTVTVMAAVPKSTYWAKCEDFRWHVREVGLVEIDVPVPAGQAAKVVLEYKWNPTSGGGLKSPHGEGER